MTAIDYAVRDYEGFRQELIAQLQEKIPEYKDFSSSDVGIVLLELLSHGFDIMSYYLDKVAGEVYLETARERDSVVHLCRLIGYEMRPGLSAKYEQVFKFTPSDQPIVIPAGYQLLVAGSDGQVFETKTELTIPASCTGDEQGSGGAYLFSVPVIHGYSVLREVIGTSDNSKWQRFVLNYAPVVIEDLVVEIDEGLGFETWTRVDSFTDSTATDFHYRVFVDETDQMYIEFGSGFAGKIPQAVNNGIVATYRVGGGVLGNVPLEAISEVVNALAGFESTKNVRVIQTGQEKETIEEAKVRAPARLRTWDRAVTKQDYIDLATLDQNVSLATAVDVLANGTVTIIVYVLPVHSSALSDELRDGLEEMYDECKEFGREVIVSGARLVPVDVELSVQAFQLFKHSELRTVVEGAMTDFFELGKRPFSELPAQSEVIGALTNITGVRAVDIELSLDTVAVDQIPILGELSLTITGGIDDE